MSQKGARKSQSTIHLSPVTAERGINFNNGANPKQGKRPREEFETPSVRLESPTASDATLEAQVSVLEIATHTYEQPTFEFEKNRAAVRLDRLTDKIDRYTSHDEFLRKCIDHKVIPLSYQVFLEPSIGNHDEIFLKGYHEMLAGFSNQVMEYTANYCKEKITVFETQQQKDTRLLSAGNSTEVFTEIKKALATNQAKRVKTLKDIKERKFIRLKYHTNSSTPRPIQRFTNDAMIQSDDRPSYSNAVQRKPSQQRLSRRSSARNINQGYQQGHLSRRNSRNNFQGHLNNGANNIEQQNNRSSNIDHQINDLEKQIKTLRQQTQQDQHRQTHPINNNNAVNANITNQPKNGERAPSPGGSTTNEEKAIDTTEILNYISTAMQTLAEFEKRLKTQLPTNPTHSDK